MFGLAASSVSLEGEAAVRQEVGQLMQELFEQTAECTVASDAPLRLFVALSSQPGQVLGDRWVQKMGFAVPPRFFLSKQRREEETYSFYRSGVVAAALSANMATEIISDCLGLSCHNCGFMNTIRCCYYGCRHHHYHCRCCHCYYR